jgi:hypothetical protein
MALIYVFSSVVHFMFSGAVSSETTYLKCVRNKPDTKVDIDKSAIFIFRGVSQRLPSIYIFLPDIFLLTFALTMVL